MRPIERIPLFLKLVDWTKLKEKWNIKEINIPIDKIEKEWLKVPDQRIGQFLINQGLVPDRFNIWNDEYSDILYEQGLDPRDFIFWTSFYDKYGKELVAPKTMLINEIETDHIKNILKSEYLIIPNNIKQIFKNELEFRKEVENLM
jgi:hypothetical protein